MCWPLNCRKNNRGKKAYGKYVPIDEKEIKGYNESGGYIYYFCCTKQEGATGEGTERDRMKSEDKECNRSIWCMQCFGRQEKECGYCGNLCKSSIDNEECTGFSESKE